MAYMSVDRPDLCHVVRTLASAMKGPKMGDWQRLKKAVRYLVTEPYLKRIFKEQPIKKFNVVALSDSDWAGDLRSRRSTTGAVIKAGEHTILVKPSPAAKASFMGRAAPRPTQSSCEESWPFGALKLAKCG